MRISEMLGVWIPFSADLSKQIITEGVKTDVGKSRREYLMDTVNHRP
jgi:hypothetical protein